MLSQPAAFAECISPGSASGLAWARLPRSRSAAAAGFAASSAFAHPDCDTYGGLKHDFLHVYSVAGHLAARVGSGRFVFGSTPVPDIHATIRMRTSTSYQALTRARLLSRAPSRVRTASARPTLSTLRPHPLAAPFLLVE